ncbi:pyridoxal-phosphate dependent enzyme, partial [Rhizobium johnstonii]
MWLKRDDCSGLAIGGNKTRKLEFLLGRALAEGATGVVTFGALQSNHARQTAAACALLGLDCDLILTKAVDRSDEHYEHSGNL